MTLSPRAAVAAFACCGVVAAVARYLPSESTAAWLLRVVSTGMAVAVIPGVLTVMAWRPRARFGFLELLAVGVGVSFALVQGLTIGAVTYSWSVTASLALLAAWIIGHAAAALRSPSTGVTVTVAAGEISVVGIVVLLGIAMYFIGSPFDSTEPRIHISLIRRLLHVTSPTFYNMYLAPDVVYTYPFPGIHYMLALMARAGDIDPFFLYHKTRVIWAVAAIILLYSCTQAVFQSARIALTATLVGVGLIVNGSFGAVVGFSWGQLTPFTHASDIAMGVMLPALLMLSFLYLNAAATRERWFFLTATLGLALTLVMVHPREIVQFLVYLGAFAAVAVALGPWRRLGVRAGVVVVAVLSIVVVYTAWHASAVPVAGDLMERERDAIGRMFADASPGELLGRPLPFLSSYLIAFPLLLSGWNWLVLLVSPLALFVLRRRRLTLLLAAGIVAYMVLIRLPILALPYLYFTYFEMLYTPVRNVIFFIHALAGVSLYLCAARLSLSSYPILVSVSLVVAGATAVMIREVGPLMEERMELVDLLFAPVLAAFAGTSWWAWRRRGAPSDDYPWIDAPRPRWALALTALCIPLFAATEVPDSSFRRLVPSSLPAAESPHAFLDSLPCLRANDSQFCPPPSGLVQFVSARLPVDGVLAVDLMEEYQPSLFMPQQMVVWPGTAEGLLPRLVFARYFERYDRAKAAYDEQPFFNDRESRSERLTFIRDLSVTHVLVNPRMHVLMTRVLAADSDVFTPLYDDGRWALYEVRTTYRGLRL